MRKALALDTSPVIALYLAEPSASWVNQQLESAEQIFMSTVNLTECLIILRQRDPDRAEEFHQQLLASTIQFIPPDTQQARLAAEARFKYPLNLGDCFAYALAKTLGVPLLTLDRDFRAVDIELVLPPAG